MHFFLLFVYNNVYTQLNDQVFLFNINNLQPIIFQEGNNNNNLK